ncbi:MAG: LptF/LptG family permease [Bacteroidota bacterium]|nr:LptF/LptG family permease [Bacteroidota bacterium]
MKRLHKFIITSFLGPFLLTFFIVVFILLMQFLWKYIEDLAGKGLPLNVLAELMFYVAASLLPMALPLAILLASLMTMGNLGENYELTAMKASGISLQRIVAPLIIFNIFLSSFAFLFSNYALPYTNLKMMSLLWDITNQKPELQIKEGVFYNGITGISMRVGSKDYKTNLLHDIKIYDHTQNNGNTAVTVADSGRIKITTDKRYLVLTLYNGYNYREATGNNNLQNRPGTSNQPFQRDKFEKQVVHHSLLGFGLNRTDESLFKDHYRMKSLRQLNLGSDSLQKELNQRTNILYNSLITSQLFRSKPYRAEVPHKADTTKNDSIKPKYVAFYTAYDSLNFNDRGTIVSQALTQARDTKAFITSSFTNTDDTDRKIRKYNIEWWRKFTLSAACLIFFFIGAPLGAIIRKGGLGMPVVISVLFFVLYYIVSLSGEKFAREGVMPPHTGMWISSLILLPIGILLTRKATRDSSMFNIDTYLNYFKKLGNLFTSKNKQGLPKL